MIERDRYEYRELRGALGPSAVSPMPSGTVTYSDLVRGKIQTQNQSFALKYVARGTVFHRIDDRTHVVPAGNFICVPPGTVTELDLKREGESSMVGICVSLPGPVDPGALQHQLEQPMIFPAACSQLGALLARGTIDLQKPSGDRRACASHLIRAIAPRLEDLLEETAMRLDTLAVAKRSTRLEIWRRINVARSYLHDVTDRSVELDELSRVAGISRFQLLRDFRTCFGAPPGAYHRRLRLELAKTMLRRGNLSCAEAARQFGFGDGSGFSRAYSRVFGEPPLRSVRAN